LWTAIHLRASGSATRQGPQRPARRQRLGCWSRLKMPPPKQIDCALGYGEDRGVGIHAVVVPSNVSVTPFECRSNNFRPTSASGALIDAVFRLRHVETSRGCRNPFGFGSGDEMADLTESQSHKKVRYQRIIFLILQWLAATQKNQCAYSFAFEKASR